MPHSPEIVRERLNALRDNKIIWDDLARLTGVPGGTLSDIASGGRIPFRHRGKLGLVALDRMKVADLSWALENRVVLLEGENHG